MYKLSVEFKTIDELVEFAKKIDGQASFSSEVPSKVPEVINEEKAPKKASTPKAPKPSPKTEEAKVSAAPSAPAQAVGRDALLAHATELVGKLKNSGIAENQIMPTINQAFQAAGIPIGQKISQLDDSSLVKFMPMFEQAVNSIIGAPQGHSFI